MPTIICFGKNYPDHMHELGDQPVDKPVIFLKPENILRACKHWNETLELVLPNEPIQFETELVFKIKSDGTLGWYTVGLDMTKRALQKKLKENGHPWTIAKVFPDAAVIGPWLPLDDLGKALSQPFSFSLNNVLRQNSIGKNMLFSPIDLISYVSEYFPLTAGDILFTGTPAGVGEIRDRDIAKVRLGEHAYKVMWKNCTF